MRNRGSRRVVAALSGAFLIAACTSAGGSDSGSDESGGGQAREPGLVNIGDGSPDPVSGGTLNVSLYSFPQSLDPAQTYGTIATSGIPMAAIYGVLMRYDPESGEYEPKLAKSLSHNTDFTKWTLELRDGVEFSDGTPLDAEAVVSNLKRIANAGKTTIAPIITKMIKDYETPDAHTVVFDLSQAWSRFPYLLASNGGMVPSPDAVAEYDDEFGRHPVGAGPFTLSDYTSNEAIVLARNPDYWDGRAHLSKVRFTQISGGDSTAERFHSGGVQMGVTLDPEIISSMVDDGTPGYLVYNHAGGWVPNQNEDHPTSDPAVRRAIAYAMDVDQLNERAVNGKAAFHRTLFPENSRWDTGKAGVGHNPDKARELVTQAKKETDWDGSLKLLAVQTQQAAWREAITLKGQLNAVGFDVQLEGLQNINQLIRHSFVKQDYDLAYWVVTAWDSAPWIALYSNMGSTSKRNPYGYASDRFDNLLGELRSAGDEQERRDVLAGMQQVWKNDQPVILNKSSENFVFWNEQVHGVVPSSLGVVLLDDAFLSR